MPESDRPATRADAAPRTVPVTPCAATSCRRTTPSGTNVSFAVAAWNGARYADTYGPTVGHDMCKAPADRWIEPLQPTSPAAPAHPNAKGEAAMARAVLDRLERRY